MWTRIYTNVRLMLERRGYSKFKEAEQVPPGAKDVTYLRPCLYADDEAKVLFVDAVGNAECRETVRQLKEEGLKHLIYVANNIPGRFNQDMDQLTLHQAKYGLRFELFEASFFMFDKMQHQLMQRCRPEPMTLQDSAKWLLDHHLEPWQLLQYVPRDFVVRYYGLQPGQIVKVNTGGVPKFRILLSTVNAAVQPLPD